MARKNSATKCKAMNDFYKRDEAKRLEKHKKRNEARKETQRMRE